MSAPHVVVVGDVILDRDVDGRVERLCPDAPAPVLDVASTRSSPGGAGLAALLCGEVTLVAPIADDAPGRELATALRAQVDLVPLGHVGPTRVKTRVRSAGHSLVRVDEGGPGTPLDVDAATLHDVVGAADVVLVSDYGAGTTHDPVVRAVLADAARRRTLVWDPHPRGGSPVADATLVTPNLAEARAAVARGVVDAADVVADPADLASALRGMWRVRAVCVTAGDRGAFLAQGEDPLFVPAPRVVGDPCGAGDRFAATVATALGHGAVLSEAVAAGVESASRWVAAGGAEGFRARAVPTPPERFPTVPGAPGDGELAALRARGTVVATGGCFDIVHAGHVATLQAARRLGDALVVLINSDASVRRLKGPLRPVVTAEDRARVLRAFDCVDAVVVFDEDDPRAALDRLRPDVWVKGGDYGGAPLPEAEVVRRHGGRVVLLPYVAGRSTTAILERTTGTAAPRPSGAAS